MFAVHVSWLHIHLKSLSGDHDKFVQNAVKNYDSMKPMILDGYYIAGFSIRRQPLCH